MKKRIVRRTVTLPRVSGRAAWLARVELLGLFKRSQVSGGDRDRLWRLPEPLEGHQEVVPRPLPPLGYDRLAVSSRALLARVATHRRSCRPLTR